MNKRKRVADLKHRQRRKKYELRAQALAVETTRPRRVRRAPVKPEVVVAKPPRSAAPKAVQPRKPRRVAAKKQDEGQEAVTASEESS